MRCATTADTRAFGRRLAAQLPGFTILVLTGDLGAGKTTLMQGLAAGWEVATEEEVASPSYTLIHEYHRSGRSLLHLDLYRIETGPQIATLGLEDVLLPPPPGERKLVAIEWGERLAASLPRPWLHLRISAAAGDDETRTVHLQWQP
ncbi:MAG TPA: tRNA (adenosine(37)-N6)-threonylcarbamoyltransferase complex ATPase subunit type 1 TsaE [Terriglobales bacterium]|nr:tRNA (adenosine(37)-N6)-threonylcarbamoyltransferase complex ATPase subunit type 1 TsaE [Terriglobales bacterium]